MPHVELPQAEFKVVMLGDSNTGKTSLVLRFAEGYYRESARSATVGAFFITKRLQVQGITCKIQIWDTAGQEQFKPLAPMYYKNAAAAILCFDVTSPQSLRTLKYWLEELHCNVPAGRIVICMAATKMDLTTTTATPTTPPLPDNHHHLHNNNNNMDNPSNEWQHLHAEAAQLAQDVGCLFVETSAKNNTNVTELFKVVAERVLQYQQTLKGKAALEIPVTRGVLESSELNRSNSATILPPLSQAPHIHNNNNNNNNNNGSQQPFSADAPFTSSSSAAMTTPARRRVNSTPDAALSSWNQLAPVSSPPQPPYYNDASTKSPFATPPLSAPSSKTSSPALSARKSFLHINGGVGVYSSYHPSVEQPLPITYNITPASAASVDYLSDEPEGMAGTTAAAATNAAASSSPDGAGLTMCGDDNPMMCGVLSQSSRWSHNDDDDDDNDGSHRKHNTDYQHYSNHHVPTSCTIL